MTVRRRVLHADRPREAGPSSHGTRWALAMILLALLGVSPDVAGQAGAASASPVGAGRADLIARTPLPPLPTVPKVLLPAPTEDELAALDAWLQRVTASDASTRQTAVKEILEHGPGLVPAIDRRLRELADGGDKNAMKRALLDTRQAARDDERKRMNAAGERGKVVTPDYLDLLTQHAQPTSEAWRRVTHLVAMSRSLVHIGSVEATRELVDVYVRFGEFMRVDTQLQLARLGDRSVAALIEAKRHEAPKVARWAVRQLDTLGKGIPSEAVQTADHQVLADVLRALGRARDPDAARIVISFANSERAQIRDAARQAVAMMGDVAGWQLRDSYENTVGKRPPRDWSWDRTARELFRELDVLRMDAVHRLLVEGKTAEDERRWDAMKAAYDKVLARTPMLEIRSEMAAGYVKFAIAVGDHRRVDAMDALRRAERISADETLRARASSLKLTLEAEGFLEGGVADQTLLHRAMELDPENERARGVLERLQRGEVDRAASVYRYLAAGAIALVALVALGFVAARRGRRSNPETPSPEGEPGTTGGAASE